MALEIPLVDVVVTLRFEIMDEDFEDIPDPHSNIRTYDATHGNLRQISLRPGSKLNFNYDFGDNWWVSLTLEEVFEDKALPGDELPRVLDGAGFGIVEDVGGTGGLEALEKAFKKKKTRFILYKCPNCGRRLNIRGRKSNHCPGCGCKLEL